MPAHRVTHRVSGSLFDDSVGSPYAPRDACGVGFIARQSGERTHEVVSLAVEAAARLAHRGASAADSSADGAGLLTQIPRRLFILAASRLGIHLPADAAVGVGMCFLPVDQRAREEAMSLVNDVLLGDGIPVLGWRDVPVRPEVLGPSARAAMPTIAQILVGRPAGSDDDAWERQLYLARREMEHRALARGLEPFYICSLSCRTVVYKGLLTGGQLGDFYPDLRDPAFETAIAVFHERYATNTMPRWELAQPFRMLGHNGEINTLWGNRNAMAMRAPLLEAPDFGAHAERLRDPIRPRGSDSASLDNALELLVRAGRSPVHATMMLVPQAWEKYPDVEPVVKAFYEYHQCVIEPWMGRRRSPTAMASRWPCRSTGTACAPVATRSAPMAWWWPAPKWASSTSIRVTWSKRASSDRAACSWWTRPASASFATWRPSVKWPRVDRTPGGSHSTWPRCPPAMAPSRSCARAISCAPHRPRSATATRICVSCSNPWRHRRRKWCGAWVTTRRWPCCRPPRRRCMRSSGSDSRRSPIRPWTRCANRW